MTLQSDLCQISDLDRIPPSDYVIACQAPSSEADTYEATYLRGTLNLMSALRRAKPKKFLFVSSSSVYGIHDGSWVDEATPVTAESSVLSANAKKLVETENLVISSTYRSMILRLSGIYGPGRNKVKVIQEGTFTPTFSEGYTNRIHVEDAAGMIHHLLENGTAGEIYIGSDDRPTTPKEFYEWLYAEMGLAMTNCTTESSALRGSKRLRNEKIKNSGYVLKYPTFEEGYSEFFQSLNTSD